jgi:hypothetical protein
LSIEPPSDTRHAGLFSEIPNPGSGNAFTSFSTDLI